MTRKGFLALALLPFLPKKKSTTPPVAVALADAGIAAVKAMQQKVVFDTQLYIKGQDIIATLNRVKRGYN